MADIFPWSEKARCLLAFCAEAHNATWDSTNGYVSAGSGFGQGILLSFAVECGLKAMLEKTGIPITRKLHKHKLGYLFGRLPPECRAMVANVYKELSNAERDQRVRVSPAKDLAACLRHHDDAFTEWRYAITDSSKFFPVQMMWACVSLLTYLYPTQDFSVKSATSLKSEVVGGRVQVQRDSSKETRE